MLKYFFLSVIFDYSQFFSKRAIHSPRYKSMRICGICYIVRYLFASVGLNAHTVAR